MKNLMMFMLVAGMSVSVFTDGSDDCSLYFNYASSKVFQDAFQCPGRVGSSDTGSKLIDTRPNSEGDSDDLFDY